MKKIVLNELQARKLMGDIINEQHEQSFVQEVKFYIYYHNVKYNGYEVDDITCNNASVKFLIELEYRTYGIKGATITIIGGTTDIELNIVYFDPNIDDTKEEILPLKINWDEVKTEKDDTIGWIGIGDEVTLELMNDETGNIIIKEILVPINSI